MVGTAGTANEMAIVRGGDDSDDDSTFEQARSSKQDSSRAQSPEDRPRRFVETSRPISVTKGCKVEGALGQQGAEIVKPTLCGSTLEKNGSGDMAIYLSSLYEAQILSGPDVACSPLIEEEGDTR